MKKFVLIVLLLSLLTVFTGCMTVTDSNGVAREVQYGLVKVAHISGNGDSIISYDPTTMICYLTMYRLHGVAASPYYIIGENGKPEIAVYGKNYFGGENQNGNK